MRLPAGLAGLLFAAGGALPAAPGPARFCVAPGGDDAWSGTLPAPGPDRKDGPFATLGRAFRAVRALRDRGLGRETLVLVRGGTYAIGRALRIGPEEAGTEDHRVTYAAWPDERPIVSGGRPIEGWARGGGSVWSADLPEVRAGRWGFRQLFADGARLPRARYPAEGYLTVEAVSPDLRTIRFKEALPDVDLAGRGAELVVFHNWSITRARIAASADRSVTTATPAGWIGHGATSTRPGDRASVEGAPIPLERPGTWYLDRSLGRLFYRAAPGEDPRRRRFVAPRAQGLLVVAGRPDTPVRNLLIRGITFAHAAWPLPPIGYAGIQAGHHGTRCRPDPEPVFPLPVAIEVSRAVDVAIERCRIAHTGASGIGIGAACRRVKVRGSRIEDIGGNGIDVGWRGRMRADGSLRTLDEDWPDPADVPSGNELAGNIIRGSGAMNAGCVGVFVAFTSGTRVVRNLLEDLPYTGISVGFRWNASPSSQRGAVIAFNHIRQCMERLADGGGIYTLGLQPGTILRGNLIHAIRRSPFARGAPNDGIFFDQGSKGFRVEGNVIFDTAGEPIRFNQCDRSWHTFAENRLGETPGETERRRLEASTGPPGPVGPEEP